MIIERLSFQAKYGMGDALVQVLRESRAMDQARNLHPRLLTDATGAMFRVILETEHDDMQALARAGLDNAANFATQEFQDWFARMQPLVERGERELLQVVDL